MGKENPSGFVSRVFSPALLFRTNEISNALPLHCYKTFSDSLTKLDWGCSFTFAKPCKSRIPRSVLMTRTAASRFWSLPNFLSSVRRRKHNFPFVISKKFAKEYLMFGKFLNSRLTRKFLLNPGLGLFLWKIQVLIRDIGGVFHFVSFANI